MLRWTNLPTQLGPYVRAADDDDRPGEIILPASDREILGIGAALDQSRHGRRRSNWYVARMYRDTRPPAAREPLDSWPFEISWKTT